MKGLFKVEEIRMGSTDDTMKLSITSVRCWFPTLSTTTSTLTEVRGRSAGLRHVWLLGSTSLTCDNGPLSPPGISFFVHLSAFVSGFGKFLP